MKKLAIITTHPIQYNAPLFQLLAQENQLSIKVFYTWSQRQKDLFDARFGKSIKWDIPILEGYNYEFINNTAKRPGTFHFRGIICPNLITEVEKWEATHILVYGWNFHAHLKAMRHFKGKIPVWFRGDSTLLDEQRSIKTLFRRLFLTWVYSYVDKAFYVGTKNMEYFTIHGMKYKQLTHAPHAINNQYFTDSDEFNYKIQATKWRSELNISESCKVYLFAGKFEPRKNLTFFLQTFCDYLLDTKDNRIKLIMVGNGPLETDLRTIAGNHPNIIFLPFQNQSKMPVLYRMADIFCLPSKSETWGLSINEALASSVPVLVSDKVGCAIDLVNQNNGLIFKSNNSISLKNAIREMSQICYSPEEIAQTIKAWNYQKIIEAIRKEIL